MKPSVEEMGKHGVDSVGSFINVLDEQNRAEANRRRAVVVQAGEVAAAADTYFQKSLDQLTLAEVIRQAQANPASVV